MFDIKKDSEGRPLQLISVGLAVLGIVALVLTATILIDVQREQEIVARIIQHLPQSDLEVAEELSGDLRLQRSLSILLVLNLLGTGIALALVVRGYFSSEQSLRDVKGFAADILASMDAGVMTTDRSGQITSINPRGLELTGLGESCLRQPLTEIGAEHRLLAQIAQEVNEHQQAIRDRDYTVSSLGHKQTLRAGCTPLRDPRGEEIGTVIHVRDVSERALMEERLRRMERYMGLGSLAAGLQHEIKNPLSALSLHIQLLDERLEQSVPDAEVHEILEVLQTEVARINEVLEGFRTYASLSELGRSSVDMKSLLEKLIRLLRPQTSRQGIAMEFEFKSGVPGTLLADSGRMEQVLLNLALNAIAAMPEGGRLTFRLEADEHQLRIGVADTGHGIPAEIHPYVFDPYFTTRHDGTGMGLALCDKIVRQHGGTIDFQSSAEGTEFTIELPRGAPS